MSKICFASVSFMDSSDDYNSSFNENGIVARTYIHETGHMLGLDDYYDYDYDIKTGYSHCMLQIDMMDGNIGDHNAFSKILLGWIDPTVVEVSGNYSITSTTETGSALLIAKDFNDNATIYREYFILEFYTATGLNSHDQSIAYGKNAYGIRVLHADGTINYDSNGNIKSNEGTYPSYFKYDNTDDDTKNFIEVLPSNPNAKLYSYSTHNGSSTYKYYNEGNVLFTNTNTVFGEDIYSSFKLNDGSDLFFTFNITSITSTKVDVSITIK